MGVELAVTSDNNNNSSIVARGRLAVLSAHLSACVEPNDFTPVVESSPVSAQVFVSPPPNLKGSLTIVDERTGKKYKIQVSDHGTVKATDFKKVYPLVNIQSFLLIRFC